MPSKSDSTPLHREYVFPFHKLFFFRLFSLLFFYRKKRKRSVQIDNEENQMPAMWIGGRLISSDRSLESHPGELSLYIFGIN